MILIEAGKSGNLAPEVITAACAGLAVILGAIGTLWLKRIDRRAEVTADGIGQKNGRGDVFKMLRDLQDSVGDVSDRVGTMDHRLLNHEDAVGRRLDGIHQAMKNDRATLHDISGRVTNLEGRTP
ncbi:MAG TPA: hypothetical protein PLB92_06110 [Rhodoglobus sp.]|nr:hypothetical protein [Rhodoglobus sp.]